VSNPATIVSAVAAAVAAVLAGWNLYLSGRREHVRWARDALVDTFVDFLTASYDHKDVCRRLLRSAPGAGTAGASQVLLDRAQDAHDQMMRCITRLRMLTTEDAVEAALRLHEYDDLHYELATRAAGRRPRRKSARYWPASMRIVTGLSGPPSECCRSCNRKAQHARAISRDLPICAVVSTGLVPIRPAQIRKSWPRRRLASFAEIRMSENCRYTPHYGARIS